MPESKKNNQAKAIARAYKEKHGKYPTRGQLIKISGFSAIIVSRALGEVKIEDIVKPQQIKFTRAQIHDVEARIKILDATFEQRVQEKVEESLSWRDIKDAETIEQANALLLRSGPGSKPFNAGEYVSIMRALHPDTSNPENRLDAFKLMNSKKLVLREEGRIELRGKRIPRTPEEWAAAKKEASELRKVRS
jgi:hypothetical protein